MVIIKFPSTIAFAHQCMLIRVSCGGGCLAESHHLENAATLQVSVFVHVKFVNFLPVNSKVNSKVNNKVNRRLLSTFSFIHTFSIHIYYSYLLFISIIHLFIYYSSISFESFTVKTQHLLKLCCPAILNQFVTIFTSEIVHKSSVSAKLLVQFLV